MEMIPAVEFNDAASAAFTRHLAPLGFERLKGHRWVCSENAPLRRLFSLYSLKGLALAPTWGFSFDFVPHLGAGHDVKWHRTAKSAQFDLPYDPIDYTLDVDGWSLSRFDSLDALDTLADALAIRAVADAASFWGRISTVDDVPAVFEEWRTRRAVRFGFQNYVRAPLAYAFVLAHLGRMPEADEWLERYLAHDMRPDAKSVLRQRLRDAQRQDRPASGSS